MYNTILIEISLGELKNKWTNSKNKSMRRNIKNIVLKMLRNWFNVANLAQMVFGLYSRAFFRISRPSRKRHMPPSNVTTAGMGSRIHRNTSAIGEPKEGELTLKVPNSGETAIPPPAGSKARPNVNTRAIADNINNPIATII